MKIKPWIGLMAVIVILLGPGAAPRAGTKEDLYQKGLELASRNIYGEAIDVLTKVIEMDDRYAPAYLERGKMYFAMSPSHCTEAHADFSKAIALAPENPLSYYERGLLNAFLLQNEQARSDMETAATLGHQGARAWLEREEASVVTAAPLERK